MTDEYINIKAYSKLSVQNRKSMLFLDHELESSSGTLYTPLAKLLARQARPGTTQDGSFVKKKFTPAGEGGSGR